jgi:hypothetical protein
MACPNNLPDAQLLPLNQSTAQHNIQLTEPVPIIPIVPVNPPPSYGDSSFWTIVAISILVKTILSQPQGTAK